MRARDLRAIAFCLSTTVGLLVLVRSASGSWIAAVALALAYAVWMFTRPRMVRVMRRMRGEHLERSGYFWEG
jgi:hypothetical protein